MTNPHTGQQEKSKPSNEEYRTGWDRIFGKAKEERKPRDEKKEDEAND